MTRTTYVEPSQVRVVLTGVCYSLWVTNRDGTLADLIFQTPTLEGMLRLMRHVIVDPAVLSAAMMQAVDATEPAWGEGGYVFRPLPRKETP